MNKPLCPIHNTEMFLAKGLHRESGGFVDNYWYCGGECNQIVPARNREEAEKQTYYQLHTQEVAEKLLKEWKGRKNETTIRTSTEL